MSFLKPTPPNCSTSSCKVNKCPDFEIKRHDTRPPLRVSIQNDDGPIDLTGLVVEASMWANAKLKKDILSTDTAIQFADNIGFDQILQNDIIATDRTRSLEQMLVTGFDEINKIVFVQRGYGGTTVSSWKKGTCLKLFRFMNSPGLTEMVYDDVMQTDGCKKTELIDSLIIYEWLPGDVCVSGYFNLEFKILKVSGQTIPTAISTCTIGQGVQWVQRIPSCGEFLIKICESFTAEVV